MFFGLAASAMIILLATRNTGKIRELAEMLSGLPFKVVGLDRFHDTREVAETGGTFAENAVLKAVGYAVQCGVHAIADDSGLEVDALGGRPGVLSARYAGQDSGYDVKMAELLKEIETSGSHERHARFVSHIALADPNGDILFEAEGVCEGTIAFEARGSNGFGYDPIFIPNGQEETFGELADRTKLSISHRARAMAKIMRYLRDFA
jgi:XTP/dITP diphosphohydrolase